MIHTALDKPFVVSLYSLHFHHGIFTSPNFRSRFRQPLVQRRDAGFLDGLEVEDGRVPLAQSLAPFRRRPVQDRHQLERRHGVRDRGLVAGEELFALEGSRVYWNIIKI